MEEKKIVTGIQGGKLSTAKKIQFLQAPVVSFVCELVQFFDRVLAPLNELLNCLFLYLFAVFTDCETSIQ